MPVSPGFIQLLKELHEGLCRALASALANNDGTAEYRQHIYDSATHLGRAIAAAEEEVAP